MNRHELADWLNIHHQYVMRLAETGRIPKPRPDRNASLPKGGKPPFVWDERAIAEIHANIASMSVPLADVQNFPPDKIITWELLQDMGLGSQSPKSIKGRTWTRDEFLELVTDGKVPGLALRCDGRYISPARPWNRNMVPTGYMGVPDLAEYLKVTVTTAHRMVNSVGFPPPDSIIGGGRKIWTEETIHNHLSKKAER